MKALFKVVMILLIGMISLSGYSSTTTSTTKKKDVIEKSNFVPPTIVAVQIDSIQMTQVENRDLVINIRSNEVESSSPGTNPTYNNYVSLAETIKPPLIQLE